VCVVVVGLALLLFVAAVELAGRWFVACRSWPQLAREVHVLAVVGVVSSDIKRSGQICGAGQQARAGCGWRLGW